MTPRDFGRPKGSSLWEPLAWPSWGTGLQGGGLAGLSLYLRKKVPSSQSWGQQGPRPWWEGVGGEAPSSEPALPPGWGTNPALIARMPPACVEGRGRPQKQQEKKGLHPPGGGESLSCWEGWGRIRADLETTRINRFGVS